MIMRLTHCMFPCQILQQRTIAIVVIAKITSMNVLIVDTCLK